MTRIDKPAWNVLSPMLDELLDMDAEQRALRVERLRTRDPALAEQLAELLVQLRTVESKRFLEGAALDSSRVFSQRRAGERREAECGEADVVRTTRLESKEDLSSSEPSNPASGSAHSPPGCDESSS